MYSFKPAFPYLTIAVLLAGNSMPAADRAWKNKPLAEWTQEDADLVMANSPWSKPVIPTILHKQSEFERRDGGEMGAPTGLGFDGVGDKESRFAGRRGGDAPTLLLRWETALPVRVARLKFHTVEPPTIDTNAYVLALYGMPGGYFKGDPLKLGKGLKDQAMLKRAGKPDVRPSRVEVFQGSGGPIVVYEFPRTLEITKDDKSMSFVAVVGRLSLMRVFDTETMQFDGKLEF
jgi:hypothetical protein